MKKILPAKGALLLVGVVIFSVTGCNKKVGQLPVTSKLCKVEKITEFFQGFLYDTISFFYNSYGNPDSIIRQHTGTAVNNYIFRYDAAHRATDVIGAYGNGSPSFETWHRLHYKGDKIYSDTLYVFGFLGDVPTKEPGQPYLNTGLLSTFQYDVQGRISRTVDWFIGLDSTITYYSYDRQGNLAKTYTTNTAGTVLYSTLYTGYDDKIDPDRENPIFQFLDRNYSMNNRFTADRYNEIGLPTAISVNPNFPAPTGYPPFYFVSLYTPITLQYACQDPGSGKIY